MIKFSLPPHLFLWFSFLRFISLLFSVTQLETPITDCTEQSAASLLSTEWHPWWSCDLLSWDMERGYLCWFVIPIAFGPISSDTETAVPTVSWDLRADLPGHSGGESEEGHVGVAATSASRKGGTASTRPSPRQSAPWSTPPEVPLSSQSSSWSRVIFTCPSVTCQ